MDIEQLKLVLETVQAAGSGAFTIAVVWFTLEFVKSLLVLSVAAGAVYTIYYLAKNAIVSGIFKSEVGTIIDERIDGEYGSVTTHSILHWIEKCQKEMPYRENRK